MNAFQHEHADPWAADFIDVQSLNAEASEAIVAAVEGIRDRGELHSRSLLVLGPAGAGKTHLFARLRRRLGPRAAFVLLRPELGAEANGRQVLAAMVDALHRSTLSGDQRQLDVVVGRLLSAIRKGANPKFPHLVLEEVSSLGEGAREEALEEVVDELEERFEDIDAQWLEMFLRAPFVKKATRRATLRWLSGREPDERALKRIGLTAPLPEESVMPALRTLGVAASFGTPFVLVFDQLENLVEPGESARIIAHANLVMELFDTVRGLVLVQMALDGVWTEHVSPALDEAKRARLEREVCFTQMPDAAQRRKLVEAWSERVEGSPPEAFPWPFEKADWQRIESAHVMTPRMLMKACRDALSGEDVLRSDAGTEPRERLSDRLAELWDTQLSLSREELDYAFREHGGLSVTRVTGALMASLRLLGVDLQAPKSKKAKHQLRTLDAAGERLLYVLQQPHPRSVAAVLRNATANAAQRNVVVLREQSMAFPPGWKTVNRELEALRTSARATWLPLDRTQLARLLSAHDFLMAARSQDLAGPDGKSIPEDAVHAWMKEHLDMSAWPATRAAQGQTTPGPADAPSLPSPASAPPSPDASAPVQALRTLGLASIDRVLRELRAGGRSWTRREVRGALEGTKGVTFFGREIVYWRGGAGL